MAKRAAAGKSAGKSDGLTFAFDASMRVVLIECKDAFVRTDCTRRLRAALEAEHGDIEQFVFQGSEATPADVLDELRSVGLMTPHKLVVVDQAEQMVKEEQRAMFERYAEQPADSATLVLRTESIPKGKLDQMIEAVGAVVRAKPPSDVDAASWLVERAKQAHGTSIAKNAAAALVARIGVDLLKLDSELGRLGALASGDAGNGAIDVALVDEQVGQSREQAVWSIQADLLSGRPGAAVRAVREALDVSRHPEELVSWAMVDLCRKINAFAVAADQRADLRGLARAMRLWGDGSERIVEIGRRLSPAAAAKLFDRAVQTDRSLKSGGDKRLGLEMLAMALGSAGSERGAG